jgi:hypothetical protein
MLRLRLSVGGLVLAAAALAMGTPAEAERDIVHFADAINIPAGATVRDAVCFFCTVNIDGAVEGDVVSFFGDVHVNGQAHRDVVNFFGDVKVADHAIVGRDLVNFFGEVKLGEAVSIDHDLVVMFGGLETKPSDTFGGDQVVEPGWLFWGPFLLIACGVVFVVREFRGYRRPRYMRGY